MILRRHGREIGAVEPDFRAEAFTEVSFRRASGFSMEWSEFADRYERVGDVALSAASDGAVQVEAELAMLRELRRRLDEAVASLAPGEVLVLESQPGHDYPRTHENTQSILENTGPRLHFHYSVDPPLRLGRFRLRG